MLGTLISSSAVSTVRDLRRDLRHLPLSRVSDPPVHLPTLYQEAFIQNHLSVSTPTASLSSGLSVWVSDETAKCSLWTLHPITKDYEEISSKVKAKEFLSACEVTSHRWWPRRGSQALFVRVQGSSNWLARETVEEIWHLSRPPGVVR